LKTPQFDRLAVKREILRASDSREISPLSYIHLEIIDPTSIDSMLIEELDAGTLEGGLTDELFFELLSESPDYLAYEPFRKCLKEWQGTLHDPESPEDAHNQAKKKLQRIGKVLAGEMRGRPPHDLPGFLLKEERDKIKQALTPFLAEAKKMILKKKVSAFREKFPNWDKCLDPMGNLPAQKHPVGKHRAPLELANQIICCLQGISRRELYNRF
jgi:hypothetical protein